MLIPIIIQYLESNKRLVIPGLGAFIVKEPGVSVVFSELLKRDDGALRLLLRESGVSEIEAAGAIDRFVFEVRHAVEGGSEYRLGGFGILKPGPNGTIAFVYEPQPVAGDSDENTAGDAMAGGKDAAITDGGDAESRVEEGVAADVSGGNTGADSRRYEHEVPGQEPLTDVPFITPSAKMSPDPSLRGLRYGKPPKNTNAYTYVDRPPRRTDRFIWLALAAAAIAIAAIIFGYICESRDSELRGPYYNEVQIETQPDTAPVGAADSQTTTMQ